MSQAILALLAPALKACPILWARLKLAWFINEIAEEITIYEWDYRLNPKWRASLDASIASREDAIERIISARTKQILGHRSKFKWMQTGLSIREPHSWETIMLRWQRMLVMLDKIKELAQRRAAHATRDNPHATCFASGGCNTASGLQACKCGEDVPASVCEAGGGGGSSHLCDETEGATSRNAHKPRGPPPLQLSKTRTTPPRRPSLRGRPHITRPSRENLLPSHRWQAGPYA